MKITLLKRTYHNTHVKLTVGVLYYSLIKVIRKNDIVELIILDDGLTHLIHEAHISRYDRITID